MKTWTRDSQKWVLLNWPKIPQIPQNVSAQIFFPSPEVWDFDEKRPNWVFVVRVYKHILTA